MNFTDKYLILGVIGAGLILLAFTMNEFNKWNSKDLIYDYTNLIGSILLLIYAISDVVWPFIILNSVWAIVSLKDIIIKE